MAYSTGSYSSIDNALALFYAWALTNGWTQNYTGADGTGQRAHISKSIGGTDFFFNLRSATAEAISPLDAYTGIALNGSTAWDGSGTAWNVQTGFTTTTYGGGSPSIGVVDELKTAGGTYYFFATATNLTAVFESDSTQLDWRMFTVGSLGGYSSFFTSGGVLKSSSGTSYDGRSSYCATTQQSVSITPNHASVFIPTEGWYNMESDSVASDTRVVRSLVKSNTTGSAPLGSVAHAVVDNSPDSFRGNAQLAPSSVMITKGVTGEYWPIADIEGVKFINMTNYDNVQEITYDGDTYKLFKIYNPYTTGVALLK